MRKFRFLAILTLVLSLPFLAGCSRTTVAKDLNGMGSPDGQVLGHLSTSNVGLHFLMGKKPLAGDASLEKTVADFTAAAREQNASKVRIVQSSRRAWWFIFFPFTVLVTPVTSNVAGEAIA
ncbi:MAG: hypothetical protein HYZ85_01880 [Candidatus Omnitrophica bacterium]|nr:hypothetical protein [Candidatus Omnitrophota bacterium]